MNSQRRRPGPPETTVVGRAGSQICRLIGSNSRTSSSTTSTISQSWKKPLSSAPTPSSRRTVEFAPSQPTTYRAVTVVPSAQPTVTTSSCCTSESTTTLRRTVMLDSWSARASIVASSSGWQNIDENGQPDGPVPMRPKRNSVVPAPLRHS